MKFITYLLIGIFFGIVLFKSEAASWFRIYEMFQFGSFHMYGIISSAVGLGIVVIQLIKRLKLSSFYGDQIKIAPKTMSFRRYLIGGIIFGLGWALSGACPGPIFTLVGAGFMPILIVLLSALIGTFIYGLVKNNLPH